MTNMDEAAIALADHAAKQAQNNPQYVQTLMLFIALIGGAWLFRWLIGRLEKQTTLLEGLFQEANRGRDEASKVIAVNSEVIREATDFLRRIKP